MGGADDTDWFDDDDPTKDAFGDDIVPVDPNATAADRIKASRDRMDLEMGYVHPEWKNVLSEEIGKDFDDLVEQVGEQVAVFAMLEWYNRWVKENTIEIEGLNHLQKDRLIENIEQTIKEAPGDQPAQGGGLAGIAKKVGSAYNLSLIHI